VLPACHCSFFRNRNEFVIGECTRIYARANNARSIRVTTAILSMIDKGTIAIRDRPHRHLRIDIARFDSCFVVSRDPRAGKFGKRGVRKASMQPAGSPNPWLFRSSAGKRHRPACMILRRRVGTPSARLLLPTAARGIVIVNNVNEVARPDNRRGRSSRDPPIIM